MAITVPLLEITLLCSELQHQVHQRLVDFLTDHNQGGAALVQSMAFYPGYPGSSNQPILSKPRYL